MEKNNNHMIVKVVDYNPNWTKQFEEEANKIQDQLVNVIQNIYHIGSTAVPNLKAKPIIDIMLEVDDLTRLDKQSFKLENLAYEAKGAFGIPGRRYFRKGGDNRTHQIHAFKSGDFNLVRHLAFRDYLIAHKNIANEYGELKFNIAQRCNNDIEQYCDEKDAFVKHHEAIAVKWYRTIKRIN